jgi:Plasmid pRiA4b ORF-3-like protein
LVLDAWKKCLDILIQIPEYRFMAAPKKIAFVPKKGERCIYQLKITLKYSDPKIWRRILIPSDMRLPELHEVIQCIMPWDDSHMHQFVHKKVYYQAKQMDDFFGGWGMEVTDYLKIRVSKLLTLAKDKMDYEYDFGDDWVHNIVLEKILPWNDNQALPFVTGGERNAPPDDSGGMWGFYAKMAVLQDPKHEEYADIREWIGVGYDPDSFDINKVNEQLL